MPAGVGFQAEPWPPPSALEPAAPILEKRPPSSARGAVDVRALRAARLVRAAAGVLRRAAAARLEAACVALL